MTTALPIASPAESPQVEEFGNALRLFRDIIDPQILNALQPTAPQTIYTTWVTVWLLVYQRLHNNATLATAVAAFLKIVGTISTNKRVKDKTLSNHTTGFNNARQRLEVEVANTAADRGKIPAKRISFSAVWSLVHVLLLNGREDLSASEWEAMFDLVLKYCCQRKLPKRPGRSFPRQVYAKRQSSFPRRGRPTEEKTVK